MLPWSLFAVLAQPSDLGLISLRLSFGAMKNLNRIRKISRKDAKHALSSKVEGGAKEKD
jgi:hypothetical protein